MTSNVPSIFLQKEGGDKELKVEDNKEFTVALAGNPSTGYSWLMANVEAVKNNNVIQPLNLNQYNTCDDYVHDPHEPGMVGFGGVYYFKFKVNNGTGKELPKLVFEYKRHWEKDKPPYGKAEITLKL